ncbi:MAG: hypothetical protein ACOY4N_11965 [Pseudomonadota bacterium]|uniref:Uncharacterized protein n=2 Tax=Sphingobium xenophagum TaxID=121428 RepID=A0A401J5C7_SPHXE|nr:MULTISPECIES: hypothetical protein [Sphingobium]MBU0657653.1 hypothetical protein [Alphaproteobacteria bacterium]MBA4753430.1 hypothetical protein [Sphingobium sp.]MBG6117755.1 hypothetical protein [Sphingobium sp. JAI105]MBU0773684.1 hypothetical protein [Alphaproteobacteria bacterium]MBU0868519.1 hypothetical protein [Alphaproteobacteria bacterium]
MRRNAMTVAFAMLFALAACGSADKGGNKVEMKDMEVVDGTATDAMTDLDGVQSEGTAVAMPNSNAADNAAAARPKPAEQKAQAEDAEVLADQ